ncbi:MAG: NAD(P)-dependent oxidoreductase [Flavobacteriales bacterium]
MPYKIVIGLVKEGKTPPDKRVPLTPAQCVLVMKKYPHVRIIAQSSDLRCFSDQDYRDAGVEVADNLTGCDIIMGVKEVPVNMLLHDKIYMFFSHTIKKQAYNQKLMREMIARHITLVDYEVLVDNEHKRIIGFGRYAGIVGAYNGLRLYAERNEDEYMIPAHACTDLKEMLEQLHRLHLRRGYKIVVTGSGRVGKGCVEVLDAAGIKKVSPADYLVKEFNDMVYTVLESEDYYEALDGSKFDETHFRANPFKYKSVLTKFTNVSDMYMACHFWDNRGPVLLSKEEINQSTRLDMVADISCDIGLPVACTIRASSIAEPFYGYDPKTGKEANYLDPNVIGVMAIDNLPCELPRDASHDFGNALIKQVFPFMFAEDGMHSNVITGATICEKGKLTPKFEYLADYAYGKR